MPDTDRSWPHAHNSRIGRTRALTTWAMADPRVLHETCMDFLLTLYHRSSLAATGVPHRRRMCSRLSGQRSCIPAEACVQSGSLRPRDASRSKHYSALIGGARGGMRDQCRSRPVIRARLRGSCKAIHDVEFGVGDSYHVVRSERDIFTARGHIAGSAMKQFPAITAGRHGGPGPIRAPDSGDDTEFWGGPPPRAGL